MICEKIEFPHRYYNPAKMLLVFAAAIAALVYYDRMVEAYVCTVAVILLSSGLGEFAIAGLHMLGDDLMNRLKNSRFVAYFSRWPDQWFDTPNTNDAYRPDRMIIGLRDPNHPGNILACELSAGEPILVVLQLGGDRGCATPVDGDLREILLSFLTQGWVLMTQQDIDQWYG